MFHVQLYIMHMCVESAKVIIESVDDSSLILYTYGMHVHMLECKVELHSPSTVGLTGRD